MTSMVTCLLVASMAAATGQTERIAIACANGPAPQLLLIGPQDLLKGERPIELPPGVGFLRSLFVRDSLAMASAPNDDADGAFCGLQDRHLIAIERVSADRNVSCMEPWSFSPILAHDGDVFVLPHDDNGDVRGTVVAVSDSMAPSRGVFRLIDLIGAYQPSAPFTLQLKPIDHDLPVRPARRYICPMRCENEKTYAEKGDCPVCGMKLQDRMAHMDHSPRHGGTFFMAPDAVHHLEGTLVADREFRLYSYDEFTRPIDAAAATAVGVASTVGDGSEWPFVLERCASGEYLVAHLDPAVAYPIAIKLRVTYSGSHEPSVYDFEFDERK